MSHLFVTGLMAAAEAAEEDRSEWITVTCANEGCDNLAEALRSLSKDGQHELFPEIEPVHCDSCQDILADQYEAEFGWMRSF